jgi:hypothetical protein
MNLVVARCNHYKKHCMCQSVKQVPAFSLVANEVLNVVLTAAGQKIRRHIFAQLKGRPKRVDGAQYKLEVRKRPCTPQRIDSYLPARAPANVIIKPSAKNF